MQCILFIERSSPGGRWLWRLLLTPSKDRRAAAWLGNRHDYATVADARAAARRWAAKLGWTIVGEDRPESDPKPESTVLS